MDNVLISPEYRLDTFCYRTLGRNPVEIMEAASAEISNARRLHRASTKQSNFRKDSRGRHYCDELQLLIVMLMGGSVPRAATPEFLQTVKPLMQQLLQEWDVGSLRAAFASDVRIRYSRN